jgi:hypothetical protein
MDGVGFTNKTSNIQMTKKEYYKMLFIMNALDNGWTVKKKNDSFVFTKKHENQKEIFQENYLEEFIRQSSTTASFS